jgi:hypothetical protein
MVMQDAVKEHSGVVGRLSSLTTPSSPSPSGERRPREGKTKNKRGRKNNKKDGQAGHGYGKAFTHRAGSGVGKKADWIGVREGGEEGEEGMRRETRVETRVITQQTRVGK